MLMLLKTLGCAMPLQNSLCRELGLLHRLYSELLLNYFIEVWIITLRYSMKKIESEGQNWWRLAGDLWGWVICASAELGSLCCSTDVEASFHPFFSIHSSPFNFHCFSVGPYVQTLDLEGILRIVHLLFSSRMKLVWIIPDLLKYA